MTYRGTTISDALDVKPISQTTWRVSDRRSGDATRGILGYIREVEHGFEMLWMRPRAGVTRRYGDFAEAVNETARHLGTLRRPD
ncbi:hypothetical protein GCM10017608_36100 [Agromyces luteolus]|uniref:Uncharacterized protein n=1 Tax=Agromyces luteolus TaxID=88373 RepID=A0A7C9HY72_9MICO|nr:hypothetical protein [Agromyces luteolus]MUN06800.1 hypothetical protein [Agromyces luteolus]GLK29672.1 hypothetical protein GCM10017608_36100 [Agromyces luteolus]